MINVLMFVMHACMNVIDECLVQSAIIGNALLLISVQISNIYVHIYPHLLLTVSDAAEEGSINCIPGFLKQERISAVASSPK